MVDMVEELEAFSQELDRRLLKEVQQRAEHVWVDIKYTYPIKGPANGTLLMGWYAMFKQITDGSQIVKLSKSNELFETQGDL